MARSILLDHHLGRLDHGRHLVAFLQLQFFGATLGDHRLDHVVTYFHRDESGDSSQQYVGDFAFDMVACTECHGLLPFGSADCQMYETSRMYEFDRKKGAPLSEGALPDGTA